MKASLLLSLCIVCVESNLRSEFARASGPSVHSLFAAGTRHKRQVRDPREERCSTEEFFRRDSAVLCDPSNDANGQLVVDIYTECNYDRNVARAIRSLVQSCSRDENGRFCFELRQNASNYTNSVTTNCPRLNTYSGYNCTDSCRDALQDLKSNIGCCLNDLYNTTLPFSNFLNAGLWSACGVISPDFCGDSTLTPGSVIANGNCSDFNDLIEQLYSRFYCNADVFRLYLDNYQQCGYHDQYDLFINLCRVTENDELCGVLVTSTISNASSYLGAVNSECLQQNFTQGCTHTCQTALNNVKSTIGCCVNLYNSFPNATNPALWSACGISFPSAELCPSTLLSTNRSSGPTTRPPGTSLSDSTNQPSATTARPPGTTTSPASTNQSSDPTARVSVTSTLASSSYNSATTLGFPNIILLLLFSALFTILQ